MGKYKSLLSNTLLFGIATFSSRLLGFFIYPLLTRILDPAQSGTVLTAIATCNLLLPIMYLCISEAIIRFGVEPGIRKTDVYTAGILTVFTGYAVMLCVLPLLSKAIGRYIAGYEDLVRVFVLTSALRTVTTHYVRASGFVRLFALDGMFTIAATFGFTYLFLFKLEWGARGYMLATICADAASVLLLTLSLRLYRFFRIRGFRWDLAKTMLRYSIPIVPTQVFWWVINLSDRYFVVSLWGDTANGLYTTASTIPSIITTISAIFIQAWQISAFSEYNRREAERFYTTVFRSYYTFVFLVASGIILLVRPITKILVEETYYDSWQYVPFLVLGITFACLVTFLGTIYNAVKKNTMVTVTTAIGAVLNILLNALMIPKMGPIGAAVATFCSYFAVFVIRAIDTRKHVRIHMQPGRIAASLLLLLAQIAVSLTEPKGGILWQILLFIGLAVCNLGYILFLARHFWEMVSSRSTAK